MYGHSVIEDLLDLKENNIVKDAGFNQGIDILIKSIKDAQHFHLGTFQEFILPLQNIFNDKSRAFLGECGEYVRLPYKTCWFEFENVAPDTPAEEDVPKRGMLVIEMGADLLWVWIVNWPRLTRKWMVSPQQYFITVGKTINDHEPIRQMATSFLTRSGANQSVIQSCYESNIWPQPMINNMDVKTSRDLQRDDHRDLVALNAALMLLNCKNVVTEDNLPPEKLNKKRRKRGKPELFTYKTLKLVLPSERQKVNEYLSTGRKIKIHLCRGHFKNYTKDAPLFGKYTGLYWWQPHVRGDKKEGVVVKDYEISTTKSQPDA